MKRFNDPSKNIAYFLFRCVSPLFDARKMALGVPRYLGFCQDFWRYTRMEGAERINLFDLYPIVHDKTATTHFDKHYFYQDIWAFQHIRAGSPQYHVDIGSRVDFVGFVSTIVRKAIFVDIRPIQAQLPGLSQVQGNILSLPFADVSIISLSCLHVAEHIGLGRYGDQLDPEGTEKACGELSRVLAPHGNLYFSLPVGKPRVCFNAHRVHSPSQILGYFKGLDLIEFAGVDDGGQFIRHADVGAFEKQSYACGLFHFRKPGKLIWQSL
jgi:SAM-dependent methyltransferase